VHRWEGVVDSQFRHPKLAAALTLAGLVVALVAVMGPRGGGVTGVTDALADQDESVVTPTTVIDPDFDDGVVFTTPGELVEVIEGPPGPETSGGATGTTGAVDAQQARSTTSVAQALTTTTTSVATSSTTTSSSAVESGTVPDGNDSRIDEVGAPVPSDRIVPVVADPATAAVPTFALDAVPNLVGSARGGPEPDRVVLGQLGTRDSNSTPWMLLIGANFLIAGGALAALRLRR